MSFSLCRGVFVLAASVWWCMLSSGRSASLYDTTDDEWLSEGKGVLETHALTHFNIIFLHFSFLWLMFSFLSLKLGGEPQGWTNVYGVLKGTNLFCYHQKEDMEANVEPVLTIGINKVSSVLFWKFQACSFMHMIYQGHSSAFGDIMRYFSLWISWKHSFKWIVSF